MRIKLLALAGLVSLLSFAAAAPASAIEVGVTNSVSNTVTSGRLQICETDNHYDSGYQQVWQVSGDLQFQEGGGGQKGIGGEGNISGFPPFGGSIGLGGAEFGDGLHYGEISGNGEFSYTDQNFSDHNVTNTHFDGQQTTSTVTTSSATFTNF